MKAISINGFDLSTRCRLCFSSGVTLLDIFWVSSKMQNSAAGVIMKCTAVQITRDDDLPNFICQSCFTQLENTHNFLMQIEKTDRTLRRYFQQLYASNKPIKTESSVQPSKDPLLHNTNKDITVKCEPELYGEFDMDLNWRVTDPDDKNNEAMSYNSEIKTEIVDAYLLSPAKCAAGTNEISSDIDREEFSCENSKIEIVATKARKNIIVSLEEKESDNGNKIMDEMSLKSEIGDDNLLILTDSFNNTENASFNSNGNKIGSEDTNINIAHASINSGLRLANVPGDFNKCEETNKKISINHQKHQKANNLKSFHCDICNKYFCEDTLCDHKRTHTEEKPYKCNVCIKCFATAAKLKSHQRTHTGEKPYKCEFCKAGFSQSSNLKRHRRIHTGEKPYQCAFCIRCFSHATSLDKHKLVHTREKHYRCDLCNKCFSDLSRFDRHKLKHTSEKPHRCDVCKKRFSELSSLYEHKLIHKNEKVYQCDICEKKFRQSASLDRHKQIHTGEKPYECSFCNKRFSVSSHLSRHKRIHTGEKPYQCDFCSECFSDSSNFKRHKLKHTAEQPYHCDLGKKDISQPFTLNRRPNDIETEHVLGF